MRLLTIFSFALLVTLLAAFLTACVGQPIKVEAAQIRLLDTEPQGCQLLGEVYGTQGNIVTGPFTKDEELISGAKNDIRNQALALGANSLWITRTNPKRTHSLDFYSFYGKAYKCP
ncbi:DUF4156 domain-containing protein [Kangiella sp. TOML190]|uniref:DUF4156 domain-containing protein n=1 Tax=Kangiella sp. TOML190 TaxID=2931351 RepID=UPI00203A7A0F|nr:DUF4156 domain-containing protein [Kangiella sp. TOML190]